MKKNEGHSFAIRGRVLWRAGNLELASRSWSKIHRFGVAWGPENISYMLATPPWDFILIEIQPILTQFIAVQTFRGRVPPPVVGQVSGGVPPPIVGAPPWGDLLGFEHDQRGGAPFDTPVYVRFPENDTSSTPNKEW